MAGAYAGALRRAAHPLSRLRLLASSALLHLLLQRRGHLRLPPPPRVHLAAAAPVAEQSAAPQGKGRRCGRGRGWPRRLLRRLGRRWGVVRLQVLRVWLQVLWVRLQLLRVRLWLLRVVTGVRSVRLRLQRRVRRWLRLLVRISVLMLVRISVLMLLRRQQLLWRGRVGAGRLPVHAGMRGGMTLAVALPVALAVALTVALATGWRTSLPRVAAVRRVQGRGREGRHLIPLRARECARAAVAPLRLHRRRRRWRSGHTRAHSRRRVVRRNVRPRVCRASDGAAHPRHDVASQVAQRLPPSAPAPRRARRLFLRAPHHGALLLLRVTHGRTAAQRERAPWVVECARASATNPLFAPRLLAQPLQLCQLLCVSRLSRHLRRARGRGAYGCGKRHAVTHPLACEQAAKRATHRRAGWPEVQQREGRQRWCAGRQ